MPQVHFKKEHVQEFVDRLLAINDFLLAAPGPDNAFTRYLQRKGVLKTRIEVSNGYLEDQEEGEQRHRLTRLFFDRQLTTRKVSDVAQPLRAMLQNITRELPRECSDQGNCRIDLDTAKALMTMCQLLTEFCDQSRFYLNKAGIHHKKQKSRTLLPLLKEIASTSHVFAATLELQIKRHQAVAVNNNWINEKTDAIGKFFKDSWQNFSDALGNKAENVKDVAGAVAYALPLPQRKQSPEEIEQENYGSIKEKMDDIRTQFADCYDQYQQSRQIPVESLDNLF